MRNHFSFSDGNDRIVLMKTNRKKGLIRDIITLAFLIVMMIAAYFMVS